MMTKHKCIYTVPTFLWAIKVLPEGHLCAPLDDDCAEGSILAYDSQAAAMIGLEFQIAQGFIEDGEVVQIK